MAPNKTTAPPPPAFVNLQQTVIEVVNEKGQPRAVHPYALLLTDQDNPEMWEKCVVFGSHYKRFAPDATLVPDRGRQLLYPFPDDAKDILEQIRAQSSEQRAPYAPASPPPQRSASSEAPSPELVAVFGEDAVTLRNAEYITVGDVASADAEDLVDLGLDPSDLIGRAKAALLGKPRRKIKRT